MVLRKLIRPSLAGWHELNDQEQGIPSHEIGIEWISQRASEAEINTELDNGSREPKTVKS
jgi:hypothetical protein